MDTSSGIYIGTMRDATIGVWTDSNRCRQVAHQIFGTPLDTRTWFTEPHGFWWGLVDMFWPSSNFIHVWLYKDLWH